MPPARRPPARPPNPERRRPPTRRPPPASRPHHPLRNGPDLYVYLSPDPAGFVDGAIELGRLRATDGSFNTPIPVGTDVGAARSVVVWCREFAVLFAVATLES